MQTLILAVWVLANSLTLTVALFYHQLGDKVVGTGYGSQASPGQGYSVSLSSDGSILAVGGSTDNNYVGATWLFRYDGSGGYTQLGDKLVGIGFEGRLPPNQGSSVSLSSDGSILAVGGPLDNYNVGATWLFRNDGSGGYIQLGDKLVGTGYNGFAFQGWSVSLSSNGSILAVGAVADNNQIGATWVFRYDGLGGYIQLGDKLVGTGYNGTSVQGASVSLSSDGSILAVGGAYDNDNVGATWVFRYDGSGGYTQLGDKLVGTGYQRLSSTQPKQGWSVSLSSNGSILAVGGRTDNGGVGATWLFRYNGSGGYAQMGDKLVGTGYQGPYTNQGSSVSLSSNGSILAVGAFVDNGLIGATWLFRYNGSGGYTQLGDKLVGTGYNGFPSQGTSVSLSSNGSILAVGGDYDNNYFGATWVFRYDGSGGYTQLGDKLVGTTAISLAPSQGWSVSLSFNGSILAVGAPYDNNFVGATWLFRYNGSGTYTQLGDKLVGTGSGGKSMQGFSVSLSSDGSILAVGGVYATANGATWLFRYNGSGGYTNLGGMLVGTGCEGNINSQQGWSVSLSSDGSILAVGGNADNNLIGATWLFRYNGSGGYTQLGDKLVGTGYQGPFGPQQGFSVSLSSNGSILAVGGPLDHNNVGATWLFRYNGSGGYVQVGDKLVGTGYQGTLNPQQGWSVSLSSDGSILAVGGRFDGRLYASSIGATWVFQYDGGSGKYTQLGSKLVGTEFIGYCSQGASVSLSSDGSTLAVGGYSDRFGFTPNGESVAGYDVTLMGVGATWIFVYNGTAYNQLGRKLVGTGYNGNSQQGYSVSLSGNGSFLAIGALNDSNAIGATWIFSTTAPPPPLPTPLPQCVKPCLKDYWVDRLVCHMNIGLVMLPKRICELEARLKKRQCLWQALTPFHCFYDKSSTLKSSV